MNIKEAFLVADRVVCHQCQTVTNHEVKIDKITLEIYFKCKICGDDIDTEDADICQ